MKSYRLVLLASCLLAAAFLTGCGMFRLQGNGGGNGGIRGNAAVSVPLGK